VGIAILNDLRYAFRLLRQRPGFTVGAGATIALAVAGSVAIFSVVYGLLFRPMVVPDADRLVVARSIDAKFPGVSSLVSFPQVQDWELSSPAFERVAAVGDIRFDVTGGGPAERLAGQAVSWNFFETLGVPPAMGRTFSAADRGGRPCVISDRVWRGRFGGDALILGREIRAGESTFTVAGIMPPGFERWRGTTDIWVPIEAVPERMPTRAGYLLYTAIGRLRPGATVADAEAQLTASVRRLESEWQDRYGAAALTLRDDVVPAESRRLLVLLALAAALVWIAACANVGSLVLARTTDRLPEFAVRAAVGASGGRLIRQALIESLLLACLGTAAGFTLAVWAVRLIVAYGPALVTRGDVVRLDGVSVIVSVVLAVVTAVAIGLLPIVSVVRSHSHAPALGSSTRSTATRRNSYVQDALVMLEITVAVIVLVGAGLVIRSLRNLQHVEQGFDSSSVLTMGISLPSRYAGPGSTEAVIDALIAALSSTPGVRETALSWDLPVPNTGSRVSLTLDSGRSLLNGNAADRPRTPGKHHVSPAYFKALGVPVLRGRAFTASDDGRGPLVAVINQTMARTHWPASDPIGQRLSTGTRKRDGTLVSPWLTIVGVVADVRYGGPEAAIKPEVYVPLAQSPVSNLFVVLKTDGDPRTFVTAARQRIAALDTDIPVFNVSTLDARMDEVMADARSRSAVVGVFALFALVLTIAGLFAAVSGRVARRSRELAVRTALGARPADVIRLVLSHAVRLIVPATCVGAGIALASTRYIANQLFGLSATDPVTFAAAAGGLAILGLLAAYVPARRAARADPIVALRAE
jgi:putative ABC transport system permease protein